MKALKLEISGIELDSFINYLADKMTFDYENHSKDMSIIFAENFYFRNNSTQLNIIIAKQSDDKILVDIIGAAGGAGIFNIDWFSEKGFIKRAYRVIKELTNENNVSIRELIAEKQEEIT